MHLHFKDNSRKGWPCRIFGGRMPPLLEIRARFDARSIVVYQAYPAAIALPAVETGRFATPFNFNRMTWIKPSFLWMMERCGWASKLGQEHVLAIRIHRNDWEEALGQAVLTSFNPAVHLDEAAWRAKFSQAKVHVQWDPERDIHGAKLKHRSIQVGISRHLIREYAEDLILSIHDITPHVHKLHHLVRKGQFEQAQRLFPTERPYPLPEGIARRLGMEIQEVYSGK